MASPRKDKLPSNKMDNPEILAVLMNLFGDVLHSDVIKSVALNSQWNCEYYFYFNFFYLILYCIILLIYHIIV